MESDRLALGEEIGHGNFGKVYSGTFVETPKLTKKVAVKSLLGEIISRILLSQNHFKFYCM